MNHYHRNIPGQRGFAQPPGGGPFPGIGDPFAQGGGASKGPFGLPNMGELKLIIDRMGGIDGILNTMQKVQKFVGTMQQMAPMLKLLTGAFGSKKAKATSVGDDDDYEWRPKKRRRRRRRTGARRRRR